jgi:hypothetical protein
MPPNPRFPLPTKRVEDSVCLLCSRLCVADLSPNKTWEKGWGYSSVVAHARPWDPSPALQQTNKLEKEFISAPDPSQPSLLQHCLTLSQVGWVQPLHSSRRN